MDTNSINRHSYITACDFIRTAAGYNKDGCKLSRADASQVRQAIAKALGMDDAELAYMLAEAEQSKTDEERTAECTRFYNAVILNNGHND